MKRDTNDALYSAPSVGKRGCRSDLGISRVDSIFMKFMSGGMSGVISRTVCAPFSRLSVLQETRVSVQSAGNLIVAEKNNIYQTLRSIYQKDGEGFGDLLIFRAYRVLSGKFRRYLPLHPLLSHQLRSVRNGLDTTSCD